MKKVLISLAVVAILAIGVAVYAQGSGWGGNYGHPGYGYHTMGTGYGGHMRGWTGGYDQNFLNETADTRRELNNKQFEYSEAIRNPNTKPETITKLETEITELQNKLYAKAPRGTYGGYSMPCWQY